jgi:F-type H+-transporting ATPase subunit epsilon
MAEKVNFELVSPERVLLSEAVGMVVIPGTEGYFGVLPGHAPFLSSVRPGTIEVHEGNGVAERIFISGGFAEVTETRCTVLADEAVNVSALDRAEIEAELARLNAGLADLERPPRAARRRPCCASTPPTRPCAWPPSSSTSWAGPPPRTEPPTSGIA